MLDEDYKYTAFISYPHEKKAKAVARRLHKSLESYKLPRAIVKKGFPKRLGTFFIDDAELRVSTELAKEIEDALISSRYMIVICSERTPESDWVLREIEYFKELGRGDHIFTLLIGGEPDTAIPHSLSKEVHAAETSDRSDANRVRAPLAADIRHKSLRKALKKLEREKIRIAASIIGISFDDLWRRDKRRKKRRRTIQLSLGGVALFISISIILFAVSGFMELAIKENLENVYSQMEVDPLAACFVINNAMRYSILSFAPETAVLAWYWRNLRYVLKGHRVNVVAIVWEESGRWFASGDVSGVVSIWETIGFRCTRQLDCGAAITKLSFSPSGRYIAVGCRAGSLDIWEWGTSRRLWEKKISDSEIIQIQWIEDTNNLIITCLDGSICLLNPAAGEIEKKLVISGDIWGIEVSPSSRFAAAIVKPDEILIFSLDNEQIIAQLNIPNIWHFAWSSDEEILYCGLTDGRIMSWNYVDAGKPSPLLTYPSGIVYIRARNDLLIAATQEGEILLIDRMTGALLAKPILTHGSIGRLELDSENGFIAVSFFGGRDIYIYNPSKTDIKILDRLPDGITSMQLSWDKKKMALGLENGIFEVRSIDSNSYLGKMRVKGEAISAIDWTRDDKYLAVGSVGGHVSIVGVDSTISIFGSLPDLGSRINSLSWSYNGDYLAVASDSTGLSIWSKTNLVRFSIADTKELGYTNIAEWNSEDDILIGVSAGRNVLYMWKGLPVSEPDSIALPMEYRTFWSTYYTVVSRRPNSNDVVLVTADGVLIVWDIDKNEFRWMRRWHNSPFVNLDWSRNGKYLAVTTYNQGLYILAGENGWEYNCFSILGTALMDTDIDLKRGRVVVAGSGLYEENGILGAVEYPSIDELKDELEKYVEWSRPDDPLYSARDSTSGEIGLRFDKDDQVWVVKNIAENFKYIGQEIQKGDTLVEINGVSLADLNALDIKEHLRGAYVRSIIMTFKSREKKEYYSTSVLRLWKLAVPYNENE